MSASSGTAAPRIVGCLARMPAEVRVEAWQPPSRQEAEAMPPLAAYPSSAWEWAPPLLQGPGGPSAATGEQRAADRPAAAAPGTAGAAPEVTPPAPAASFAALAGLAPDQFAPFLSHEHPQTIALILSQLAPVQAAELLAQLPEAMQTDVAHRIATMESITPDVLQQIGEGLESSLRDILAGTQDVGGPKVVADILNNAGSAVEKRVLDGMDAQDPLVAEAVRNLMFVFEDIAKLTDREVQTLLREVDRKDLVVALKAASDELKAKVLNNMSEQVRTSIQEEMEFLGPMRLAEVEEVQLRIVQQVRQLEEQGKVTIVRGAAPDVFV
ncbi:MAG: flagellar motor switch protein FliG [Candidatus Latescibacterota bacterium]